MPTVHHQERCNGQETHDARLTKRQAYFLFVSHILYMWNSRMYEFAVVRLLQYSFRVRKLSNPLDMMVTMT